jgi:hypothetical protein
VIGLDPVRGHDLSRSCPRQKENPGGISNP